MILIPAFASVSSVYEISGRPRKERSGFKRFSPALRRREPEPAIKITACEILLLIADNISSDPRFGYAGVATGKSEARSSIEKHPQPLLAATGSPARLTSERAAQPAPVLAPRPCCARRCSTFLPLSLRNADHVSGFGSPHR